MNKTEVMSLNTMHRKGIQLDGKNLTSARAFTYLGSIPTTGGGAEEDIKAKLGKARGAFRNLKNILEVLHRKQEHPPR